jgi:hypothetical protein
VLDSLVFDLSYGANAPDFDASAMASAASVLEAARSALVRTWPWLFTLLGWMGVALWRQNHEGELP